MNSSALPDSRQAVLAQLSASIDQFFDEGRVVQVLPSAGYEPPRPRRETQTVVASEATREKLNARQARLNEIRELATTLTYKQVMALTGLSQSALVRAAARGGFKFRRDPNHGKGNLGKKFSDPVVDREKADWIVAYRNVGMTRAEVVRTLEISYKQLSRILREFEIDFPTTAQRRASRQL